MMGVFVLGSINLDAVARVDDLPRPGETVAGVSLELFPGGKGANQAVAAARMGAPTRLMGAVGKEDSGPSLKIKLAGYGVQVSDVTELTSIPTGQAHVWVSSSGENMIVVTSGANATLTPQHVAATSLEGQRVLLCQLETPAPAIEALFRAGAAKGALRILNAAPALPQGAALFPLTDILILNQTELATYARLGHEPTRLEEISRVARKLMSRPDQTVIVTLGSRAARSRRSTRQGPAIASAAPWPPTWPPIWTCGRPSSTPTPPRPCPSRSPAPRRPCPAGGKSSSS
jgi:ribokinase